MKKEITKKIDELEEFLISDLPTKIFPMKRIMEETLLREDFFKTKEEVKKYIEEHFEILKEKIEKLK